MPATVVQITDCHLFADSRAELKGICTRASLDRVLSSLRECFPTVDRLVVSGDLAHDEQVETYQQLRELLGDWLPRLRLIPGNHDDRAAIRAVFAEQVPGGSGPLAFVDSLPGWRLIGLDSQVPGALHGQVGESQLDWLDAQLRGGSQLATLLFVHHPPVSVSSPWLDQIGLADADRLAEVVGRHPCVRAICTGHVHQEFSGQLAGVSVLTTPSTGVQFRPRTEVLECDSLAPGFRVLELAEDGSLLTRVVRV